MSILIKRYPNRKLYDTVAKQYIALEGISELIRQGNEVKIVDNVTGEDLTAIILSQVILENEKKRIGFLPHTVLASLIQSGGTTIGAMRREFISSLDSLTHIDEEISHRFNLLVEAGDLTLDQAEELVQKLHVVGQRKVDLTSPVEKVLQAVLGRGGIASRTELQELSKQIENLSAKLDSLSRIQTNSVDQD